MSDDQKARRLVKLLKDIAAHMEECVSLFGDLMKAGYDRDRVLRLAVKEGANREIVRRLLQICYAVYTEELHPQLIKHLESRPTLLPKAMSLGKDEQAQLLKLTVDECAEKLKRVRAPKPQPTDSVVRVVRCPEGLKVECEGTSMILTESSAVHLAKTILGMVNKSEAA